MKKLVFALSVAVVSAGPFASKQATADRQQSNITPTKVQITEGPQLERATDNWAILRWTTNNVKGTGLRYGVVHYGTDPHDLGETAKSPNRRNPGLPSMIYRVQVNYLEPGTTYYYRVETENALHVSEGPASAIARFTTNRPR